MKSRKQAQDNRDRCQHCHGDPRIQRTMASFVEFHHYVCCTATGGDERWMKREEAGFQNRSAQLWSFRILRSKVQLFALSVLSNSALKSGGVRRESGKYRIHANDIWGMDWIGSNLLGHELAICQKGVLIMTPDGRFAFSFMLE